MAFTPKSTIALCNVPFDNTYKHQVYFKDKTEQNVYFTNKVVKTFTDYLTVRKTLPDGNTQSRVKVDCDIDTLQNLNCNYMFYKNENHSSKIYYAFIKKLIYINEGTTEIVFETDVFQTWFFDVEIKESYVVREHSEQDFIGANVVPEKFAYQDYIYSRAKSDTTLNEWGYLLGSSEFYTHSSQSVGADFVCHSGIYQGIYFYYIESTHLLNVLIEELQKMSGECILFIAVVPRFSVGNAEIVDVFDLEIVDELSQGINGIVRQTKTPNTETITIDFTSLAFSFDGYTPTNKKLYTSPFFNLVVSNNNGQEAEYNLEDFVSRNSVQFKYYGDISCNPSITLVPLDYKGLFENFDSGISIGGFPQCAFNSDTFKLWLAKNQYSIGMQSLTGIGQIAMGVGMAVGSGGTASAIGMTQIVSGASTLLNSINSVYQASKEPNKVQSGNSKNNLITAMGKNKFEFYARRIKREFAETVDAYFTMYGYQTNKLKMPNLASRPKFNYVETIDINIIGGIPCEDMNILKGIFNSGVTLWKPTATMFDYSVDNSPIG